MCLEGHYCFIINYFSKNFNHLSTKLHFLKRRFHKNNSLKVLFVYNWTGFGTDLLTTC